MDALAAGYDPLSKHTSPQNTDRTPLLTATTTTTTYGIVSQPQAQPMFVFTAPPAAPGADPSTIRPRFDPFTGQPLPGQASPPVQSVYTPAVASVPAHDTAQLNEALPFYSKE